MTTTEELLERARVMAWELETAGEHPAANVIYDLTALLQEAHVNPHDPEALLKLHRCIEEQGVFPPEPEATYEAWVRHMGRLARERACRFSETEKVNVVSPGRIIVKDSADRFLGYHCRVTIEALYPLGEAVEVVKPSDIKGL